MRDFISISTAVLQQITDVNNERNIYVHPNPLARFIFWQRLVYAHRIARQHTQLGMRTLDLGGGSGVFLPSLCSLFDDVSVLDLDLQDARNIAGHFGLNGVDFYQQDMNSFEVGALFDVVVATDVLEHFADINEPYRFLRRALKKNGYLLLSLPTENRLYEIGRLVVRKQKPADHYHAARDLVRFYRTNGYELVRGVYAPRLAGLSVPLFYICLLHKAF